MAGIFEVNTSTPKRMALFKPSNLIKVQQTPAKPQGDPTKGALTKINNKQKLQVKYNQPNSYNETNSTLKTFLENKDTPTSDALAYFVEQKMTSAIKKALAINILAIAVQQQGVRIVKVSELSASITGFSATCISKWSKDYYESLQGFSDKDIEDKWISELMLSGRGHHHKSCNLLKYDTFQTEAREYIHKTKPCKTKHTTQHHNETLPNP